MIRIKTLKARLLFASVLAVLALLVLTIVDIYSVNKSTDALASVFENRVQPTAALQDIDDDLKEVRFRMAGFLLDQMPAAGSRNQLKEVRASIPQEWNTFKEKSAGNLFSDEAKAQIGKIDAKLSALPAFFDKLDKAYGAEEKPTVSTMLEDEWPTIQAGLLKPISQLLPQQRQAVRETYEQSRADGKRLISLGVAIFGVSLIVLGFFGWRIQTEINHGISSIKAALAEIAQGNLGIRVALKSQDEFGEMAKSLDETAARLREIIGSVQSAAEKAAQSSDGMSQQVELLIERGHARNERIMAVSAAMEQITVANSEVSSLAGNAAEAVKRNEELAHNGDANMGKNQAAMEKVVATVNSSVNIINKLSDSIQKIGQITTVIKEIAEQTNLLALNAAIEAARAGEQGRGFAVVADEVRKLAERTSASTNEISGVVDLIRSETGAAVGAMGEVDREVGEGASFSRLTGEALKQIVEAANKVTKMVEQIARSTKEQASATDDVARNLEGISAVTEENAASIQQVGDTSLQVAHIATELQNIVGQFKL